ncbi:MAG TPA: electron transfer flavoprotein subunit beta [Firmicutes bacterium]|jgi:electron transfer flavoprotein beta subunit|nr:electron transfer flavoprotein subunit beta/FixA family protein [Bacillota bacterium]HAA35069.1 electron transfer flavoprotein subunit beta [Bacillota bacterium]
MKTFVCIKRVPDTSEAEVKVDATGKDVDNSRFSFDINDADNYAVEEAVLIKEAKGGTVQVVCLGPQDADVMIRMALAKGGDSAIRIDDPRINVLDPLKVAKVLAAVVKGQEFDLVLTGCMANDDGNMAVGVAMAEELGVPHAAMVKKLEVEDGKVKAHRELEGGISEVVEIDLPAVITIQTGINEPRYAPIRGIRQAQKKELKVLKLEDLGLAESDVNADSSLVELQKLYIPEVVSHAEIIEGEPEEKAEIMATKLVKGGLL